MTNERHTSELRIKHRHSSDWCRVLLTANEVDERRLQLADLGEVELRSGDGTYVTQDKVRLLCGSGIAWARSNLKLAAGIVVTIFSIEGELSSEHERGVCHAVALAIAQSLKSKIDPNVLLNPDWEESPMV
jgi:hypothetical protein